MKKRILIVEDNTQHREILHEVLSYENFTVKSLPDGSGLFASIVTFKPDLIIMDFLLPGENGVELSTKIKTKSWTRSIPVILVSAYVGILQVYNCCDWVMCKPLDLDVLINKIKELLPVVHLPAPIFQTDDNQLQL
jgi:DNA-binding response OmpR family regulator